MMIMNKLYVYMNKNFNQIIVLVVATVFLGFLEKFPYLNTFLSSPYPWNSFLLLFLLTIILFRLTEVFTFGIAFTFLCIAMVLSVFGKDMVAQSVGKIVYYLLWFGFLQMVIRLWRDSRRT